ncbi:MAG TPA: flavodoxin domain-containing protein [Candidatus Acidoferrales bacterium]|nr:flavodoxin domain-containing protein [Candidatus Acidoferrales bacterium]
MPRTIVVYRSTSGFTKKYAEWIAQECQAELCDARKISPEKFSEYQVVIFGGSLHAVGISGLKLIRNNMALLKDKRVIVFAVGASPPRDNVHKEVREHNLGSEMADVEFFYLRGGFDYSKLDFGNKVLMTLFKVRLMFKKKRTPDEIGMLAAYSKPMDCTKKENIKSLVQFATS